MNQSLALGLVLSLVDRISTPLKAIQRAQDSYSASLRKMDSALLKTSKSWDILEKSVGRAGAPYAKAIDQANTMIGLGQKMAIRGAAGVAMGIVPVVDAAAVEQAMAEAATLGDMTAKEFASRYGRSVMDISVNYGQAQTGVVKAMHQALSKQISADDVVPFMDQTAKLAKAGVTDIFTATDLAMTIKNAYKIPVADLGKNFDLMFQTVRSGGTTLPEIARNFQTVGASASSAGVSLANVQAAVAQMTLSGVSTERAYTALRATITALRAPGSQAQDVFKRLGITMNAEVLQQKDLIGTMSMLEQKLSTLSVADRAQAMRDIFGSEESMLFVNDFMKGGNQYTAMLAQMSGSTGALDEAFKKMSGTTANKWQSVWQTIKAVSTALGNSLLPYVNKLLDLVKLVGLGLAHFMDRHKILTGIIFGGVLAAFSLVTALGVLFIAFGMVTKAAAGYRIAMNLITTQRGRVLTAIRGITGGVLQSARGMGGGIATMFPQILSGALSFAGRFGTIMRGAFVTGPWGWIALALTGVFLLIKKFSGPLQAFFGGVWSGIKTAFAPMIVYFIPLIQGLASMWHWFTSLLAPVKAGEKGFQRFAEAGKTVGKVLAVVGTATLLLTPLGWLYGALFGIAWLVRKYWYPLGAFFKGFWEGFEDGTAPVKEALNGILKALEPLLPMLDRLFDLAVKFGLIDESTQKLEGWARAGRLAGQALAFMFKTTPAIGFLMIISKIVDYLNRIDLTAAGQKMVRTLYDGIMSMVGLPLRAMKNLADNLISPFANPSLAGSPAGRGLSSAPSATDMLGLMFGGNASGSKGSTGGGATAKFGDILINIPGTSASPAEIAAATKDGIEQALRKGWN